MQDTPRLHLDPDPALAWAAGAVLPLSPGQAHHLGGVLRRAAGDAVRPFNARDGEWDAEIATLRKERGGVRLRRRLRAPAPEPGPVLLFAPLKRDATDLVVRMATELGAAAIGPVFTERTNAARVNLERWRAIATEAAEQCERLGVPEMRQPVRLPDLLGGWDRSVPLLAALERAPEGEDPRMAPAAWRVGTAASIQPGLLVGPEGGFSPAERRMLAGSGFVVPIRLGPLVLRADTAAAAALAGLVASSFASSFASGFASSFASPSASPDASPAAGHSASSPADPSAGPSADPSASPAAGPDASPPAGPLD